MKTLRWLIALGAVIVTASVVILWDAHRRAEAALVRHEARVAADIAALRARLAEQHARFREGEPYGRDLDIEAMRALSLRPEDLRKAKERNDSGRFMRYEDGWGADADRTWPRLDPALLTLRSPSDCLLALAVAQDTGRWGALFSAKHRFEVESHVLTRWATFLERRTFSAADLSFMAERLTRLHASRPFLEDAFAAEYILKRRTFIRMLRKSLPRGPDDLPVPRWSSFYSEKLQMVGMLHECDEDLRRWGGNPHSVYLLQSSYDSEDLDALYKDHARVEMLWTLGRVATAVAWCEVETGAFPQTLDALVPRYLLKIAVCPLTGKPLQYAPGRLSSPNSDDAPWKILGRSP